MSEETFTGNEMPDAMVDAMFSDAEPVTQAAPVAADAAIADIAPVADELEAPAPVDEVDEPAPVEAAPAEPTEELPEGAQLRTRNGKEEIFYEKSRGLAIYSGYKLAQEAENVIGEPLSMEAITDRQISHEWYQNQHFDTISDNPKAQSEVFRNIFHDAAKAISNGEIGHDPLETMGEAFLTSLREVAPEHYERAAAVVLTERIQSLYQEAARTGNEKLMRTVQNLDHIVNGKYIDDAGVKKLATTPVDDREQRLTQREQAIARHDQQQHEQAYQVWHGSTKAAINDAVKSVLKAQIPEAISKAIEATPDGGRRLEATQKLLDFEVREAIKSDPKWIGQNADLFKLARMAPTEQRRDAIQKQITQRYEQKARQVMTAKAKSILDAQSVGIKTANAATHAKLRDGASQTGSPTAGKPATRSIPGTLPANATWDQFVDSVG